MSSPRCVEVGPLQKSTFATPEVAPTAPLLLLTASLEVEGSSISGRKFDQQLAASALWTAQPGFALLPREHNQCKQQEMPPRPANPTSPKQRDPHVPVVDERQEGKTYANPERPTQQPRTAASRPTSSTRWSTLLRHARALGAHEVLDGVLFPFMDTVWDSSTFRRIIVPSMRSAPG